MSRLIVAHVGHVGQASAKLLLQEASLFSDLRHPGLCLIEDVLMMDECPAIVYEESAAVHVIMQKQHALVSVRHKICQLVQVVAFLHGRRIYHGGLRPNVLLQQENGLLKLGGLESARVLVQQQKGIMLTPTSPTVYTAPEILLGEKEGFPADIWAIGCICAELLQGV